MSSTQTHYKKPEIDFYKTVVMPELSVFARKYGLKNRHGAYLKYIEGQNKSSVPHEVSSFVKAFNIRNKNRIWMHDGKILTFDLSLEHPNYVILHLHNKPEIDILRIVHENEELKFTRNTLLIGVLGGAVLLSGTTYFYAVIVFVVGYFITHAVGRKIAARFGFFW